MRVHHLPAGRDTVHWGYFDAALTPCLSVSSGDELVVTTVSGTAHQMPPEPYIVPPELQEIHASVPRKLGTGHICTGPVAVAGARPGMVLQIDIVEIALRQDWGYNVVYPSESALPDGDMAPALMHISLDASRMVGRLPSGIEIPLRPFFGVLAVAPPREWGLISSIPPRQNGGNIDNRELVAGSTLYLPIFVTDALFSVGDGHAAQGDGEVCGGAIETSLGGRFRLTLREDIKLAWPMAETRSHFMTMAFGPDLDECVVVATRAMLDLVCSRMGLSREEAYSLCSFAAHLRITQVVNTNKGVHMMIEKSLLNARKH